MVHKQLIVRRERAVNRSYSQWHLPVAPTVVNIADDPGHHAVNVVACALDDNDVAETPRRDQFVENGVLSVAGIDEQKLGLRQLGRIEPQAPVAGVAIRAAAVEGHAQDCGRCQSVPPVQKPADAAGANGYRWASEVTRRQLLKYLP